MIPKKLHYCWFGKNPLDKMGRESFKSWKRYFPDYEIIEWNESNFDVQSCAYVKEAYEAKKWAFVSDYARFKILYEHGGVYFDTDVEVLKSFTPVLERGSFMGRERAERSVNPGLGLAAEPGMPIIQEIIEDYEKSSFLNPDGTLNLTTIVERTTNILNRHGLEKTDAIQQVAGLNIYPREYFCPIDMDTWRLTITDNTYSIHKYAGSWETTNNKLRGKIYRFLNRYFGKKVADFVKKIFGKKRKSD